MSWREHERVLGEALRYLGFHVTVRGGDVYLLREIFAEDDTSLGEHTVLSVTELAGALESITPPATRKAHANETRRHFPKQVLQGGRIPGHTASVRDRNKPDRKIGERRQNRE
jgi:hypothetical protein